MRERTYKDVTEFKDLREMLEITGEKYGDNTAYILRTDKPDVFKKITHKEYRDEVKAFGTQLVSMGLKDKKIAVISENRYEWGVVYMAVINGTGVIVPLDRALPGHEIENLINRSGAEAIVYSKKYDEVMNRLKDENSTKIKYFISMDLEKKENGVYSYKELLNEGKEKLENGNRDFLDAKIDVDKMSVMLFTSGTTAMSKAVMLSQKNICANLYDIVTVIKMYEDDVFLSFLPLHHTFECTVGFMLALHSGSTTAFCRGIRYIADDIKEYRATAMISVPILFENMYKKVIKTITKKGKLKTVQRGIKISRFLLKFGIDIRKKIFKEIHDTLGGKVRIFVAGGAAFDAETERGFNDLGFMTYQGYGLTETSPVIASEDDKYRKIGSIGKPFPSVDVKIENPDANGIGELVMIIKKQLMKCWRRAVGSIQEI